jgi:hypothetical protein
MLIATAGLFLSSSGMALASPAQKPANSTAQKQALPKTTSKTTTHVSHGTVTSIDNDKLILSHKGKNGKAAERTFMLNSKTEKRGDLKPGSDVSVHYRTENNQLVATSVQATPHKMASNAKKPVTKK